VSAVISCDNVAAGYADRPVLSGVTFELRQGEVVALLGPNGGGKSTLLKTLAGLVPKLSGSIKVIDGAIEALTAREIARRIGFVPQDESWQFDFSVEEVVAMGRLAKSNGFFETQEDREAALEAMGQAGCLDLRSRPITELSGGERQRVLIARALAQETPILFLDEPTAHLDPQYQVEITSLVRRAADRGKSVLVALHDLPIAGVMADRATLIHSGGASPALDIDQLLQSDEIEKAYATGFERVRTSNGRLVVIASTRG